MTEDPKDSRAGKSLLVGALGGLFAVSVSWFSILYIRGVEKSSLDMEFAKALLQVGLVSVIATVLSLLVFGHQNRVQANQRSTELRIEAQRHAEVLARTRLQFRDEHLKGTLDRITTAYNDTKRARRKMRALGLHHATNVVSVRLERYDDCMADVSDAQLELEAIKSDVKTSGPAFASADRLAPSLRNMERYLGALIEEYESVRGKAQAGAPILALTSLPHFRDFVGPTSGSKFSQEFSGAHADARAAIRKDLLNLNLTDQAD